jgi:transcriptional regulator with XRE-family HTH domain
MTTQATGDEQNPATEQPRPAGAMEPALNPLQRLIQQRLRERGWSYREVARRGGLPHSTVHTLAATRNLARPPRPATIDALAKGLDVPVSAVRAAAAASTGLHYYDEAPGEPENPGDPERELLIASIDELTPEERRHVAALVESLRNRAEREPGGSLAPPRALSSHRQPRGHAELVGQLLVRILRQHQPGRPQDHPGIRTRRPQHVDRAVRLALRHDDPVIVG